METLSLYRYLTRKSSPLLNRLLNYRAQNGKENPERLQERRGIPSEPRPEGVLCWIHAASVGEAQSALILIHTLLRHRPDLKILITSGTLTSSRMLEKNLPERALHQFYPLDHPEWVCSFLDHWRPNCTLWMESELWPNMLSEISARKIPALLINARMSEASFKRWRLFKRTISRLLGVFSDILCQTERDALNFKKLGAHTVQVTDNLKYSAQPLSAEDADLKNMSGALGSRPCWVYASTHKGEELLAAQAHEILKNVLPDLLTIIVPRHPERGDMIVQDLASYSLKAQLRGAQKNLPAYDTDLYIVDTLGELGLFYRIAPIAVIGRSFSDDGGGGHNPIEAAQLGCAVLHGPHVQNLQEIFDEMDRAEASILIDQKEKLPQTLLRLLTQPQDLQIYQKTALEFARTKEHVIDRVSAVVFKMIDTLPTVKNTQ
jgi:3-deoxy-D-manno-octulosonic-acid transferase